MVPPPVRAVRNVVIRDIQIINDPASLHPTSSENAAIVVAGGVDITIDRVKMDYWHRAIKLVRCTRSRVTRCRIEDARYIGIGVYDGDGPVAESDRNEVAGNELVGNTQVSGGIYVSGAGTLVRDNTLQFTHGICAEAYGDGRIENNQIDRSPYGIQQRRPLPHALSSPRHRCAVRPDGRRQPSAAGHRKLLGRGADRDGRRGLR